MNVGVNLKDEIFFCDSIYYSRAFLFSLTIDQMGDTVHLMMKSIGFICFFIAVFIIKGKPEKQ